MALRVLTSTPISEPPPYDNAVLVHSSLISRDGKRGYFVWEVDAPYHPANAPIKPEGLRVALLHWDFKYDYLTIQYLFCRSDTDSIADLHAFFLREFPDQLP